MTNPKIALYQPEIAGNVGSIIRTIACLRGELHIIEPCGFVFDKQKIRRSSLDYFDKIKIIRHNSFTDFHQNEVKKNNSRMILLTTKAKETYNNFNFQENDILLFGKESAGVPDNIHNQSNHQIKIDIQNNCRSLNLAISVAIILSHYQISF